MRQKRSIYYIALFLVSMIVLSLKIMKDDTNSLNRQIRQFDREHKGSRAEQEERERDKRGLDKPDGYATFFNRIKTKPDKEESTYKTNYLYHELLKAKGTLTNTKQTKSARALPVWVQRGPANVGGRTRCILLDPDDSTHNTWFAGSVSGGIWKTTNAGLTWNNLTPDIRFLATTTLAMSQSNTNIMYAGTGEGYGGYGMVMGNGIYKSTDKGTSWTLLSSTDSSKAFQYVNKVWVSPTNDNIVLVASNRGIFRSTNGGESWDSVYKKGYAIQDLVQNPENEKTLYAAANRLGILKSIDGGINWFPAYSGMGTGKRFSIAVSSVDTSYIYSAAEVSSSSMDIYISTDAAQTWLKHNDAIGSMINFHGVQGWFNNVIEPHPYDKNKLFVGGVYLGMVEFQKNTLYGDNEIIRVDTLGTAPFMGFVNFGGSWLGGGMVSGLNEGADVEAEDYTSIKILFGPGHKQKAHRFTVPEGEGGGVPSKYYYYQDYVEVPFEVWDITNKRQLMVSFRDQERDSVFNLVEREFDNDTLGREYIFVHSIDYADTPDEDIAQDGGYEKKMMYFFWPTLPKDKKWKPDSLPEANIQVEYGAQHYRDLYSYTLSDDRKNENLHVDHHDMITIPVDESQDLFTIIDANDGGVAVSYNSGESWEMMTNGYITTQFYGVAKKPGAYEFIGGMQDNGTWQSAKGEVATSSTDYDFRVEGDGFEALWHPWYPSRIIGSSYTNYIKLSMDGGETWEWITDGLGSDGPFITRLSHSLDAPNVIFAVGGRGVYRHVNFGTGRYQWQLIQLGDGWNISSSAESSHLVEVSLADPNVVWAGEGMYQDPDLSIFVSKDQGVTYKRTKNWAEEKMGYISGLATHPDTASIAYVMFSMQGEPKILKTKNFGESWEDISGFGQDSSSSNGFPDVAVFSLLVMPEANNIIWVGTEIGIFESTDYGNTWHYLQSNFPAVSVWELKIVDKVIIAATHGRGIWTAELSSVRNAIYENQETTEEANEEIQQETEEDNTEKIIFYPNPARDYITIEVSKKPEANSTWHLYNMKGQLVKDGILDNTKMQVDISNLNGGTYIARFIINGKVREEKLIVR